MELVGKILCNKYRIEKLLGQGGMGSVWGGKHQLTGRKIAIKILDDKYVGNANVTERFRREARAASAIPHEGIVEILDIDQMGDVPFMVMEFLEGRSLADRIDNGLPMTQEQLLHVGSQLLDALHAAHEVGVVHRDLKPDNIYLVPGRRGDVVKILDFGISSKDDETDNKLTVTGTVLGTPHYMSPEQAMGESKTDRRVDIYAAGVVLYECVVGAVPFDGPNYNKLLRVILDSNPELPTKRGAKITPAVERVILRALSKNREDRPATAAIMRNELLVAAGMTTSEPPLPDPSGIARVPHLPQLPNLPSVTEDSVAMRWESASLAEPAQESKSRPDVTLPPARAEQRRPESPVGIDPFESMANAPGSGAIEIDEGALKAARPSRDDISPAGTQRPSGVMPAAGGTRPSGQLPATRASQSMAAVGNTRSPLPPSSGQATAAKSNANPHAPSSPEPEARSPFAVWGIAGLVATVAVACLALGLRSMHDTPTPPTLPQTDPIVEVPDANIATPTKVAPAFVNVIVNIQPATAVVRMRLDGVSGATSPLRLRGGRTHVLEVSAEGFEDQRVEIQADRDQRLHIELEARH